MFVRLSVCLSVCLFVSAVYVHKHVAANPEILLRTASVTLPVGTLYDTMTGIPAFLQSICASCCDSLSLFRALLVDGSTTVEIGAAPAIIPMLIDCNELRASSARPM